MGFPERCATIDTVYFETYLEPLQAKANGGAKAAICSPLTFSMIDKGAASWVGTANFGYACLNECALYEEVVHRKVEMRW